MCDTEKERKKSEKLFKKAETVVEFMEIWSKFYLNEVCIPTYLDKFIGAEDNPEATIELGKKLEEITKRGVLAIDSQVNIPGNQKGYIYGYIPNKMADLVITNLNRYSGIVAFYSDIRDFRKENINVNEGLFVTYDALSEEIEKSVVNKKMLGKPYTTLGSSEVESLKFIREWLNDKLSKKIKAKNYKFFTVISPCFDSPPELVFDKLLEVLRNI